MGSEPWGGEAVSDAVSDADPGLHESPERPSERGRTGALPTFLTVGQQCNQPPPEAACPGGGTLCPESQAPARPQGNW